MSLGIHLAERGWLPDATVRWGIRRLLGERLRELADSDPALTFGVGGTDALAVDTDEANAQHYNVPPEFFRIVLGAHMKYSCCWYEPEQNADALDEAEAAMLRLTAERAGISDGMDILDLGCGWGSFSLWAAKRFPASCILAVSNASEQGAYIRREAARQGLSNINVVTADINHFRPRQRFDRIVSVEMIEHVRNHAELFRRMGEWLKDDGSAFIHHFCHKSHAYLYETRNDRDWMARHFFTGGTMPAWDTLRNLDSPLAPVQSWRVNGEHYAKTCRAWLNRLDANREQVIEVFARRHGRNARTIVQRWRMFFMACEELFAYRDGEEWFVAHHLLAPVSSKTRSSDPSEITVSV